LVRNLDNIENYYADAVIITDKEGKIIYSNIYNDFYGNRRKSELTYQINKSILELYPGLDKANSTVMNCLRKGKPVFIEGQLLEDYRGREVWINSLNIPIVARGEVVGVIELTQDIFKASDNIHTNRYGINFSPRASKKNNGNGREDLFIAKYNFDDIITANKIMQENIEKAKKIANNMSSVLVYGETGTGKELFVNSIHNWSYRRQEPFIVQNCAALPENLFESILFGTVKGAYTGALDKPGLFELADKGTLFFDEIHSMSKNLQAKLLRVLQDGVVRRIGDSKDRKVDVRIIAAMNVDPLKAVEMEQLREDLFYRLNVVSLKLLPLRERKEDISLYVKHYIDRYNLEFGKRVSGLSEEVKNLFMAYDWPGNVREIKHTIEASVGIVEQGNIEMQHLPEYLIEKYRLLKEENKKCEDKPKEYNFLDRRQTLRDTLASIEKQMIMKTLTQADGNITRAAEILGISRQSLHYKLDKHNINQIFATS